MASARGRIVLGGLCPRVEDLEASVGRCAQLQKVARIRPGKISDELLRNVVSGAAFARKMKLPKGLEPRRLFDDVPGRRRASLCGAVIHDGYAGSDAVHQRGTPALARAMMRNDVDVDCTQLVHGTHHFHLLVPGEVAQIQNPQLPKRNDCAERERVFRLVGWAVFGVLTARILIPCSRQRPIEQSTVRAYDFGFDSLKRQNLSRFDNHPFAIFLCQQHLIVPPDLLGWRVVVFAVFSMIDERSDGNSCGKLSGTSAMILVVMRDERSEEHTSELQSLAYLVCRLLLEKKK